MFECLIIGDSIATGVAQLAPQCRSLAKVGISSRGWNKTYGGMLEPAKRIVVSLGTNDGESQDTYQQLFQLRARLQAQSVTWILPSEQVKPLGRYFVSYVAYQYGDLVTSIPGHLVRKDAIHPTQPGYVELTKALSLNTR